MKSHERIVGLLLVVVAVSCLGCSGEDPNRKETVPVSGQVTVKGEAAEGVMLTFVPVGGIDKAQPTVTTALTDKDGKFKASTYDVGDGVPLGDYTVTIKWPKLNKMSMAFEGDLLKGKYDDPQKSPYELTVVSGPAIDMGQIDL